MSKFRKASILTQLFGNALSYNNHEYASWVCGFIFFKEDIGQDTIKLIAEDRLLVIPRFRSRFDAAQAGFIELDGSEIELDYHVKTVDQVLDIKQISDDYVGNVYKNFEFDPSKPLWQLVYFPKIEDGRALLLTKIAHTIGDGVSQIELLYRLLDNYSEQKLQHPSKMPGQQKRKPPSSAFGPLNRAKIFLGGGMRAISGTLEGPDSISPLTRADVKKVGKKNTGFSEALSLTKIKELKSKYEDATINDILMALLTLTIRACFQDIEDESRTKLKLEKMKIRAGFAINSRKPGAEIFRDGSPCNAAYQGNFRFPLNLSSRVNLVWIVKQQLDKIKLSPGPLVQQKIATALMLLLPRRVSTKLFINVLGNITALLSNVPGPMQTATLKGHEVDDLQFLLSTPRSCYIGILSYNNKVSCGVCLDETTQITPEKFAKCWKAEFESLCNETFAFDGIITRPRNIWRSL